MNNYQQSLFEDLLSLDIERQSEWEGPAGFLLGGMSVPDRQQLATQYVTAAETLVVAIDRRRVADYEVAYPVLFLYRHAIELLLKDILGAVQSHNLSALANRLDAYVKDRFGQQLSPWILAAIRDIAAIDEDSTTFRYFDTSDWSYNNEPDPHGEARIGRVHPLILSEHYVDLHRLSQQMKDATGALIRIANLPLPAAAPTTNSG